MHGLIAVRSPHSPKVTVIYGLNGVAVMNEWELYAE